jgi:cobalt-zinc-cadmium resistance protein CzcA
MLEKILGFSIEHRFLVVLLTLFAGIGGGYALTKLPIDAVPDITNVQVQINTEFPALSPVEVEKQVTFPIETALAGIPALSYTRSLSRNGFSQVTAVFQDGTDIYFARQQVAERLLEAREHLPPRAEPKMGPISTGLGEVYMWSVEYAHPDGVGATPVKNGEAGWQKDGSYVTPEGQVLATHVEKAAYLRTAEDWIIRPQIKGIPGVAGVDSIGGFVKQYHVQPDPMKLVSYGLTFQDVITALEANNVSTGAGYIEHNGESYLVRSDGRIENVEEIAKIVVGTESGTPIFIGDVAQVGVGEELRTGTASRSGQETVVGTALMLIGENSRTVSNAVDVKLRTIGASLPPDVIAVPVMNRTKLVDATISTVQKNLVEGAILVIVVLFLLLGNMRAALITAAAIPLSMLMTAIGMIYAKISGNLMSLGAIDFGLVVDGAVIIVENCLKRLGEKQHEMGRKLFTHERIQEVLQATKEVTKPSVFGQAIIIVVYVPILTLTGVEGKTFHPMAMTVIFALIAAFILSVTFVPAMVAICISGEVKEQESVFFTKTKSFYEKKLTFATRNRLVVVVIAGLLFLSSIAVFQFLGQEFVPVMDEKDVAMHAMRIPSTAISQSTAMQLKVEKAIGSVPEVEFVFSKTGTAEMAADPMPPNLSDTFVIFKARDRWPDPGLQKPELLAKLEKALAPVPGNNFEFTQPIQMRFNELIAGVRSDVAVKVYGDDFVSMEKTAKKIASSLQGVRGSADVKIEQTAGLPVMNIRVNRDALARYGLSMDFVQNVLSIAIGGREAGLIFEGDQRFDLIVRLPDQLRQNIDDLATLPIPLPQPKEDGGLKKVQSRGGHVHEKVRTDKVAFVPLGELAAIEVSEGPNQVSRENGKRRIVVQANVRGRDLGSFVEDAQKRIASDVKIEPGQWMEWGGQFENLVAARQRLSIVVPVCFALIFLLLFSAFNSVKYALVVFSSVPLALSGGVFSLWLRGMPFSISASVGFIALSGVAVLNGLVVVNFINQLRDSGVALAEAVFRGMSARLRPVLMTALVASLGFLPMAFATGTGAEVQRPLATVVVGGLITSTILTLLVLPGVYLLFEGRKRTGSLPT